MKLINTLSHMPFKSGDDLYFCHSPGAAEFWSTPTDFGRANGVKPDLTLFQPWTLARLREGNVTILNMGMVAKSPALLFCNPVINGDNLTFIYNRKLWKVSLSDTSNPTVLRSGVYTGYLADDVLVYRDLKTHSSFSIGDETVNLDFDEIVRLIPSDDSIIVTGIKNKHPYSLLRNADGDLFRIKVSGEDVYKCCIDGTNLIHAVKEEGFEIRYLHSDEFELIPEP